MLFRSLRRRRLLRAPFPPAWAQVLERLPFHASLDEEEKATLRGIVRVLVAEKHWEGCGGLRLTDEMKVTIAAQAARLLLHLDHDHYRNVLTVLVYPTAFALPARLATDHLPAGDPRIGEAWHAGPVVLAWDAVEEAVRAPERGRNVVLHEFAHKLDLLDGYVDGRPPLLGRPADRRWTKVMGEEYERLVEQERRGERTVLDAYGAKDRGEFFSVATECFFERPGPLREHLPTLYDVLRRYYRNDPAARAP